ncbi:hypothetical protein ES702_00566 [subsurface metagenome]
MNRTYVCKGCGRTWGSEDTIFDYIQSCPDCGRTTRPDNLPSIIHYSVRGSEPRHALCSVTTFDGLDNFSLRRTTCKDCLKILSTGEGLYKKCLFCAKFTQATNRPTYTFCVSDIQPEDAVFDPKLGQYLSADAIDKGCKTQFRFSNKWKRFFEKSLASDKLRSEEQ